VLGDSTDTEGSMKSKKGKKLSFWRNIGYDRWEQSRDPYLQPFPNREGVAIVDRIVLINHGRIRSASRLNFFPAEVESIPDGRARSRRLGRPFVFPAGPFKPCAAATIGCAPST
jgi:hypothetical protein